MEKILFTRFFFFSCERCTIPDIMDSLRFLEFMIEGLKPYCYPFALLPHFGKLRGKPSAASFRARWEVQYYMWEPSPNPTH